MSSDIRNVKLGVCSVLFNGIDLGYTMGGVDVTIGTTTHPVQIDQFGKSSVNEYIMSRDAKVKAPLAETTLANLVAIMPGSALVTDSAKQKVTVTHGIGIDLLSVARTLILHPVANAASARNDDFALILCMCAGALQFSYKLDQERIFPVEFSGYPSSQTKNLFVVGDVMASAVATVLDFSTDVFTTVAHGLVTGQAVLLDAVAYPTNVIGAAYGTTLFVGKIDADTFSLYATAADAIAATSKVNFSSAGTTVKIIGL